VTFIKGQLQDRARKYDVAPKFVCVMICLNGPAPITLQASFASLDEILVPPGIMTSSAFDPENISLIDESSHKQFPTCLIGQSCGHILYSTLTLVEVLRENPI